MPYAYATADQLPSELVKLLAIPLQKRCEDGVGKIHFPQWSVTLRVITQG